MDVLYVSYASFGTEMNRSLKMNLVFVILRSGSIPPK